MKQARAIMTGALDAATADYGRVRASSLLAEHRALRDVLDPFPRFDVSGPFRAEKRDYQPVAEPVDREHGHRARL